MDLDLAAYAAANYSGHDSAWVVTDKQADHVNAYGLAERTDERFNRANGVIGRTVDIEAGMLCLYTIYECDSEDIAADMWRSRLDDLESWEGVANFVGLRGEQDGSVFEEYVYLRRIS